jgi:hypothetical protein
VTARTGDVPAQAMGLEVEAWRMVAIALASELAEVGADSRCDAVRAYNHARNGRMTEALGVLTTTCEHYWTDDKLPMCVKCGLVLR